MPKVACFKVAGLDLWFNSNDHLPPHFHAEKPGHWHIKVLFLRERSDMREAVSDGTPRPRELKKLLDQAEAHRVELLREWEAKVNVTTPGSAR